MTDKIQHIIDSIRLKCKDLYSQLETERTLRLKCEADLLNNNSEILNLKDQLNDSKIENERLKSELELIIKQKIDREQESLKDRNEEIDDLVREIEYCIKQLK